tara:strand:+ start:157 stop:258 length:102 start_codon:yes stop_codon:yes gene_type:complete
VWTNRKYSMAIRRKKFLELGVGTIAYTIIPKSF